MNHSLLVFVLLLLAYPGTSTGDNNRYYYPYTGPHRSYGYRHRPNIDLDLSQIRRDLRAQRLSESADRRQHEQELNLLRQHAMKSQQVSAGQACYYRSTGGFELCADLFTSDTNELAECETLVIQRNPGCNEQAFIKPP